MNRSLLRKLTILLGDWGALYLSLFLLVVTRYGAEWDLQWERHLTPFSLLFPLWLIALYASYLYETRFLRPSIDAFRAIGVAISASFVVSIAFFYLFPPGLIQPRRNLLIFTVIFAVTLIIWRVLAYKAVRSRVKTNILFVGDGPQVKELLKLFKNNSDLGYKSTGVFDGKSLSAETITSHIKEAEVGLVVVKSTGGSSGNVFSLLSTGITVIDLEDFYERLLNKVSPEMLDDAWFIRALENVNLGVYEFGKRLMDVLIAILGLGVLTILFVPVALMIALDSRGPIIFSQERVGRNGQLFKIYKFRTMKALAPDGSAETEGAKWARSNDRRVTRVGRVLRNMRIDELPQFWNILMGDLSFVGPRPERPEFVEKLRKAVPHYDMRHLVRPGLTGWAQINYRYGASIKDAHIKLQYDIYYAKKRSLMLDLAIILKTMKIVLTGKGR